jgi:flagellin
MPAINTNVKALAAQSSMNNVDRSLQTSMQRLSTGLRINNAKDDAAGLAISNRMTSDIRGFGVAIRNANDGLSMAQTADGALGQVTDMLQRMRELAVQAGNGSLNADNRIASQLEVDQLKQQIDNIATQTNFNSINLLDGSAGNIKLQTNVRANQQMVMSIDSAQTKDIGLGSRASLTSTGFSGTQQAEQQKVTLSTNSTGQVTFLGRAINASVSGKTPTQTVTQIIADKANVLATATSIAAGITDITADPTDGASLILTYGGANGIGDVALIATSTSAATVFSAGTELVKGTKADTYAKTMAAGDMIVNGIQVGASKASDDLLSTVNKGSSAIAKVAAINAVSSQSGVTATIGNTASAGSAMQVAATTGALTINGVNTSTITTVGDAGLDRAAVVTAINNISQQTGVRAVDTGDINKGVNLIADDGRNISMSYGGSLNSNSTGLGSFSATRIGATTGTGIAITDATTVTTLGASGDTFKINGKTVTLGTVTGTATLTEFKTAIDNAGISGLSVDITTSAGNIILNSTSGNIYVDTGSSTTLTATGLAKVFGNNFSISSAPNQVYTGTYQLFSQNGSPIQVNSTSNGDLRTAGLSAGTFTANTSVATTTDRAVAAGGAGASKTTTGTLEAGTLRINGTSIVAASTGDDAASASFVAGTSTAITSSAKGASAIAIAAAINKSSGTTGVTATAAPNTVTGTTWDNTNVPTGNLYVNGVTVSLSTLAAGYTRSDVATLINTQSGQTGVTATDNGRGLSLVAQDGRNISLALSGSAKASAVGILGTAFGMADDVTAVTNTTAANSATTYSRVTLSSDKSFTVEGGSDGNANFALLGFKTGTFGGVDNGVKVSKIDISTQAGAQVAITALDAALKSVSLNQARLGAFQNRLDQVVSNLTTMNQNMSASRSRVQDADYATETTNLAKSQIISQAATAMLAQANQSSQSVLALLK